jgi:DNA-binding transcriptional ArsR family regulator
MLSYVAIFTHMGEYLEPALDATFHALANPTRRAIIARLTQGEQTVLQIAAHHPMSLNSVSKHLKVLEQAGLLTRRIAGRTHYCSLRPEPLRAAEGWLVTSRRFWAERLDALEQYLEQQTPPDSGNEGRDA